MPTPGTFVPRLAVPHEPTLSDRLHHRDSRAVDYRFPIHEEDESSGTASEPAEPLTPTSHNSESMPFAPSLGPEDHPDHVFAAPKPAASPVPAGPVPQPSPLPINPRQNSPPQPRQSSPEKLGLGRRVGSFMRSRLHRSTDGSSQSDTSKPGSADASPRTRPAKTTTIVRTGVDGPAEVATPALEIPKQARRLSTFSLTRRSDRSARPSSPPISASPISMLDVGDPAPAPGQTPVPSTARSTRDRPRSGITWAASGNAKGAKKHGWARKRSASQEQVPRVVQDAEQPTAGMLTTFSKPANEGIGMKARRLSLNLPDEFIIDWCDLDKEFKSSSLMPGKRGKLLGKGATSEVRIMARRSAASKDEELVAVKEFRERDQDETEEDYVMKIKSEYSIAKSLHHPNIVETVRLCTNRGRWDHVMEFCSYGEIYSLVERKLFAGGVEGFYSRDDRLCFFKQLLRGVDYLHCHGIAHRDIKLENLLLSKEGYLKISDFGVAEVFSGEHPGLRASGGECGKNMGRVRLSAPGICGSLPYIAPEVLEKSHAYDPRPLDIWSCAVVYLTMTFGGCPWQAAKPEFEYYARFKKGWDQWLVGHPDGHITDGPDGHPKCGKLFSLIEPPSIKRLILKMLHPIPSKRITITDIMRAPCIRNINCCCPETYDEPTVVFDAAKAHQTVKFAPAKKFLHHHIPPKQETKAGKALKPF